MNPKTKDTPLAAAFRQVQDLSETNRYLSSRNTDLRRRATELEQALREVLEARLCVRAACERAHTILNPN